MAEMPPQPFNLPFGMDVVPTISYCCAALIITKDGDSHDRQDH